jgi:hypothetical protein
MAGMNKIIVVAAVVAATFASTVASAQDVRSRAASADLAVSVTVVKSCQVGTGEDAQRVALSCTRGVVPARTHVAPAADASAGVRSLQPTAKTAAVATIHF